MIVVSDITPQEARRDVTDIVTVLVLIFIFFFFLVILVHRVVQRDGIGDRLTLALAFVRRAEAAGLRKSGAVFGSHFG